MSVPSVQQFGFPNQTNTGVLKHFESGKNLIADVRGTAGYVLERSLLQKVRPVSLKWSW